MNEREKLMERYDDAAFALMMDECAEQEGAAFLAEFQAAAQAGDLPELPEDIDRACRDTIKREYAGRERKVRFRQFRRAAARVAVAVFAVIGILGTLVMSVEAWRNTVLGRFMKETDGGTLITWEEPLQGFRDVSVATFEAMLPDGYVRVSEAITENVTMVVYADENENLAQLYIVPASGNVTLDTEGAVCTEIVLGDFNALLIEEPPKCMVVWENQEEGVLCTVQGQLPTETILEISEELVKIK